MLGGSEVASQEDNNEHAPPLAEVYKSEDYIAEQANKRRKLLSSLASDVVGRCAGMLAR